MHRLVSLLCLSLFFTATCAGAQALSWRDILARGTPPAPDQVLSYGAQATQTAQLWLPKTAPGVPLPVAVLIHGGCWLSDYPGPELVAYLADALRNKGMAVWSITYRRVGLKENVQGGGYPHTFDDVGAALDYLRVLAPRHGLDLDRIVVTGHSAGGHLALWAASRPRLPHDSPLYKAAALPVRAAVSIAGLPDLAYALDASAHACGTGTVAKLVDLDKRGKQAYRDTSPQEMLPLGVAQSMIAGVYDGIAPPVHGWRYRSQAQAKGEQVALLNLEDAGHFELIAPWTPAGKAVVEAIAGAVR
ncbi:MAG TPA: alpha/beta hydrolase [Burkholderiaceae bacterium]